MKFLAKGDKNSWHAITWKLFKLKPNYTNMNLINEYNEKYRFFHNITGCAMLVHRKYKPGLLESAYEAALKYVLEQQGYKVERQVYLPIFWDDIQLDQTYRMDLVINDNIIVELKAIAHIDTPQRRQLWNYMNLTHIQYGMIINFGAESLYSEWYERDDKSGEIEKIKLL